MSRSFDSSSTYSSGYPGDTVGSIMITDLENFDIAVVESSAQVQVLDERRRGTPRVIEKTVSVFNIIVEDHKYILSLVRYIPDFIEFDQKIKTHYKKSRLILPVLIDPFAEAPAENLRSSRGENRRSGMFKNFFSRQNFSGGAAQKSNSEKIEDYLRKAVSIPEIRNSSIFRDFLACQREEDASALKDVVQGIVQRQAVLAERQSEERARNERASRENARFEQEPDDDLAEIFAKDHEERHDFRKSLRDSRMEDPDFLRSSTNSNRSSSSKRTITNKKSLRSSTNNSPRLRKVEELERDIKPTKVSIQDFQLIKVLGKGCMGKVLLVREHRTKRLFALKSISKEWVILQREIEHTKSERDILARVAEISHPFLIKLHYSFQTHSQLFLVLDYYVGGDIATQLAKYHRFDTERCRLYAAEIVLGIEELHRLGIVYRDLKPENILLTADGHIVLTDFGLSKQFTPTLRDLESDQKTNTFCGTAEYLAPEILRGEDYSYAVDYWSLGTLLYEMITGITPFWAENHAEMYRRVLEDYLEFPEDFDPVVADFISGLLERDPEARLGSGANGTKDVKNHPYFSNLKWNDVYNKCYVPPYVPELASETDFSNFDDCFLTMTPRLSAPAENMMLTQSVQNVFEGYSYIDGGLLAQSKHSEDEYEDVEEEDEEEYEDYEEGEEEEEDEEDDEEEEKVYKNGRRYASPRSSKKRAAPMSFDDEFLSQGQVEYEQRLSGSKRANNTERYEVRRDEEVEYVRLAKQAQLRAANEHLDKLNPNLSRGSKGSSKGSANSTPKNSPKSSPKNSPKNSPKSSLNNGTPKGSPKGSPKSTKSSRYVPDIESSSTSDSDSYDEKFMRTARSSGNKQNNAAYLAEERKRGSKLRNEEGYDYAYEKQQSELYLMSQPAPRRRENYTEVESHQNSLDFERDDDEYTSVSDVSTPRQELSYLEEARVPEYNEPNFRASVPAKSRQLKKQTSMSLLFGGDKKKVLAASQPAPKNTKKKLFGF